MRLKLLIASSIIFAFVLVLARSNPANAAGPGCSSDSPSGAFCEKFFNVVDPGSTDPAFSRDVSVVNYDFGSGSPDPSVIVNRFSGSWKGKFVFVAGDHQFTTTTDDGVRLKIDGVLVIDKWVNQAAKSYTYSQFMTAGEHEVEMLFYENTGYAVAKLNWFTIPGLNCSSEFPETEFCIRYYNNENLLGSHIISLTGPEVNFNFGLGSPDVTIPVNLFSARYTKRVNFADAGVWKFKSTTDDGVRVYVDDVLVIDKWVNQPATAHFGSIYLNEGMHNVKMEYFENYGAAVAKLSWALDIDGCNDNELPTNAFCSRFFKPRAAIDTISIDSKTVPEVNFNYGSGSPSPLVPSNDFAATFEGNFEIIAAGTYLFTTTSDDGVRLRVDGALVIDKWVNQATTSHYALVQIPVAGETHPILLDYFENGGQANVKLTWVNVDLMFDCTSDNPSNKFCATYFNGQNFDLGPLKSEELAFINKNYGGGGPGAPINTDFFSANYLGTFGFTEPGIYRFTTSTDDGVRLRVDGTTVIDKWIAQPLTSYTADVEITAGDHEISMDYFEKTGAAIVKLTWVKIADLPVITPAAFESSDDSTTVPELPTTTEPALPAETEPAVVGSTEPEGVGGT